MFYANIIYFYEIVYFVLSGYVEDIIVVFYTFELFDDLYKNVGNDPIQHEDILFFFIHAMLRFVIYYNFSLLN
jgi:hypothetical protein